VTTFYEAILIETINKKGKANMDNQDINPGQLLKISGNYWKAGK